MLHSYIFNVLQQSLVTSPQCECVNNSLVIADIIVDF